MAAVAVDLGFCDRKLAELTTEEDALEASPVTIGDNNDLSLQIGIAARELAYKSREIYGSSRFIPMEDRHAISLRDLPRSVITSS